MHRTRGLNSFFISSKLLFYFSKTGPVLTENEGNVTHFIALFFQSHDDQITAMQKRINMLTSENARLRRENAKNAEQAKQMKRGELFPGMGKKDMLTLKRAGSDLNNKDGEKKAKHGDRSRCEQNERFWFSGLLLLKTTKLPTLVLAEIRKYLGHLQIYFITNIV